MGKKKHKNKNIPYKKDANLKWFFIGALVLGLLFTTVSKYMTKDRVSGKYVPLHHRKKIIIDKRFQYNKRKPHGYTNRY